MNFLGRLLVPGIALFLTNHLQAQMQRVWQIGKFDQSPVEFSAKKIGAVDFQVGTSRESEDWPRQQKTGVPYRIRFSLTAVAKSYRLKLGALIDAPRIPAVRMDINGHAGRFYLHPELSYSRSDFAYAFDPHEAQSTLEINLPAAYLKAGDNVLTLTPEDDPQTASNDEEIGGFSYDALSLESSSLAPTRENNAVQLRAEPTVFYRQSTAGLVEVVDLFIRFRRPWPAGHVDLQIDTRHYPAAIQAGEFGERKVSVEVPEWQGTFNGTVKLTQDRRSYPVSLTPQRKWTIFVVPHTHLDVGFTDYQGKVAETQPRVLTQADNLIHEYPDFRFSMDGSWNLQQLLETRSKGRQDEILNLIREGKMAMPAQYCNLLTGYASLETLYRSLYYSKELAMRYGLPFEYANITDVPTYSGSYPSILASSGVKYWVAAANNDRAPIFFYDHWNERSPFWWTGPDGKKVLFWYSRHYEQVQTLFGLPPQLYAVRESLPVYLQAYSKPSYKPDVALLYGTQVENTDLVPSTATFATEWNKQYAFPKLTYSTFPDFFHYLDSHFAKDLPDFKGDGSGYWEDGIGSDSYYQAEDRQNQNRALSAEILSSVTHSIDPNLNPPEGLFADIWRNIILFAEHTWLSYNSVSQPDHEESVKQLRVKDDRAERAALEIDDAMNRSLSQLADQIHIPANTLVVFNSLNWKRDGLVETDLLENPELTDLTTQQGVPLQVLYEKQNFVHVRFLAKDLPPAGYKCFRIEYRTERTSPAAKITGTTVESAFYRLTVDESSGSVSSIFDKQLQKEIVDQSSPYKFGQYLYVTGGDGDTQMINPFPALPPGKLAVHLSGRGKLIETEQQPWGKTIRLSSQTINTPSIETEILLFENEKKIEFHYRVHKDYTTDKEAVYFAFPAAAPDPHFTFATQQGWVDPARDIMKGGSLEWFNVQQWMAVSGSNLTIGIVPLDASLASFGDINRGKWPGAFHPSSSTIFSYAMNNYWHTNYRAGQGGDFSFRFAVTSADKLEGGALSRLGLEEMRPFEVNTVVSQDKVGNPPRPLPPEGKAFIEVSDPDIALITWKRAANGDGEILRFQELSGTPKRTTVRFPGGHSPVRLAHLCSGVEENVGDIAVQDGAVPLTFRPFEVVTIRVAGT